jgi:hypothetical protein
MGNIISERLKEIGMTVNQLSCLSGVKNSHLKQIIDGIIQNPGRNILIRIGLALSWGVEGINRLLKNYEQDGLAETDISYFIEAVGKRQIPSGFGAVHPGGFNFEIAVMSVEKMPGDIRLVTPIPHIVFREFEEYFSSDLVPGTQKKNHVYKEIRRFLFKERIRMFDENIKFHKIRHLICRDCFESYIREKGQTDADSAAKEFNSLFRTLAHKNYDLKLAATCPCFKFHIREPNEHHKKPVVIFAGNPKHPPSSRSLNASEKAGALTGFVSDSEILYGSFAAEFERLHEFATDESSGKERLIKYIIALLEKNGIKGKREI